MFYIKFIYYVMFYESNKTKIIVMKKISEFFMKTLYMKVSYAHTSEE